MDDKVKDTNLSNVISKKIYIFSLGNDNFQEEFEDFENVETESFPAPMISVYNRLLN